MNSIERTLRTIEFKPVDRVPVDLHNFLITARIMGSEEYGDFFRDAEAMAEGEDFANTPRPNRVNDIWIWSGYPVWDPIFEHMKRTRSADCDKIGVCFCGATVVGKQLKAQTQKHSRAGDVIFDLHKENF